MFKKLIGIIIIIFIINSAGVLLLGGGSAGIAAEQEPVSNVMVKEAVGNVDNVPKIQSEADVLRTLFKRALDDKVKKAETLSIREKCSGGYYKSITAMSIIVSELKNIRKLHLMNYLLAKRILYIHPDAIDRYLTLNFAMLERSVFEIFLTVDIIRNQLERMEDVKTKDVEAKKMIEEILDMEEEILNHFFSFYKVFRTEE